MNKLILASLLSVASLAAFSQSVTPNETVTVPGHALRIDAPTHVRYMDKDEFYPYRATYTLANGQELTLSARGNRMFAEVDDLGKHQIVATSANSFTALDQQLQMTIHLQPNDNITGELLMVVPESTISDGTVAPARTVSLAVR
ncbi:hypothetical protein H3H36_07055 [Duganella sp. FT3S]|uniref:Uncharacterized protein n=1 Tax=Rugamonas fusca TaxID=2758568 RepID=A0A7W2I648_9BURK|nr:hypothetical protein [Rugamonas fusca]MBA5605121.1 hypothetical protein [Rugamonas fusca]